MESETKCAYIRLEKRLEERSRKTSGAWDKVPRQLRDVNKKAYEPEVISIGPNYHGRDEFKKMEDMKMDNMLSLLKRKPGLRLEDYYFPIEAAVQEALNCYGEAMSLEQDEFIDMLILDGCFIIQLICGRNNDTYTHRRSLQRDLLLLENQIPFFVLCKLFDIIHEPVKCSLIERVLLFFKCIFPGRVLYKDTLERNPEEVRHVLDLIHFNWCPRKPSESVSLSIPPTSSESDATNTRLMSITTISPLIIPSASRLVEANVKFTPSKLREPEGALNSFDVKFNYDCGKLVLPRLVIDGGTESLLRNLIAYEQMLPSDEHTPITDYALLLDSLIDDATDVQILDKYWIIDNRLSSDEAVADFVNRLTYKIIYQTNKFMYSNLFDCINTYYFNQLRKGTMRRNRFVKEYFNSPWTIITAPAGTVYFLLTVVQVVLATLEYYQRP